MDTHGYESLKLGSIMTCGRPCIGLDFFRRNARAKRGEVIEACIFCEVGIRKPYEVCERCTTEILQKLARKFEKDTGVKLMLYKKPWVAHIGPDEDETNQSCAPVTDPSVE